MTEKELIISAKNGDKASLEKIVETYYGDVYRFLSRRHGDSFLAEDITQDTFIKFTQSLSTYSEKGKLKSFLFSIAVNCSNDYFRKTKALKIQSLEENTDLNFETPEMRLEFSAQAESVKQALLSLDEKFRDIVILRYYHDMKLGEIGKTLGIPTATVKTRLHRANKYLKESLKGEHYE